MKGLVKLCEACRPNSLFAGRGVTDDDVRFRGLQLGQGRVLTAEQHLQSLLHGSAARQGVCSAVRRNNCGASSQFLARSQALASP